MELILGGILSAVIITVSFLGGYKCGWDSKPATNIINISQDNKHESRQETIIYTMQGQIMVRVQDTNRVDIINLNIQGLTNIKIIRSSNSNSYSLTN